MKNFMYPKLQIIKPKFVDIIRMVHVFRIKHAILPMECKNSKDKNPHIILRTKKSLN